MGGVSWQIHDQLKAENKHLRAIVFAPLSPDELRLVDKHCEWVAFGHAWNAIMKQRRAAIAKADEPTKEREGT